MSRGLINYVTYDAVTEIPLLIPCEAAERDGTANLTPPNAGFKEILAGLHPVRVLRDEDLDKDSKAGRKFWSGLPETDRNRLLALIGLRQALEGDDRLSVKKRADAFLTIIPEILAEWRTPTRQKSLLEKVVAASQNAPQSGMSDSMRADFHTVLAGLFAKREQSLGVLQRLLNHAVREARLMLWQRGGEKNLLPAIYCPDKATALYVRALVRIGGGRALLVCPHCGDPFLQKRSDQDYCSIRCREAHRVARWRADKVRSKSKRRKHT